MSSASYDQLGDSSELWFCPSCLTRHSHTHTRHSQSNLSQIYPVPIDSVNTSQPPHADSSATRNLSLNQTQQRSHFFSNQGQDLSSVAAEQLENDITQGGDQFIIYPIWYCLIQLIYNLWLWVYCKSASLIDSDSDSDNQNQDDKIPLISSLRPTDHPTLTAKGRGIIFVSSTSTAKVSRRREDLLKHSLSLLVLPRYYHWNWVVVKWFHQLCQYSPKLP